MEWLAQGHTASGGRTPGAWLQGLSASPHTRPLQELNSCARPPPPGKQGPESCRFVMPLPSSLKCKSWRLQRAKGPLILRWVRGSLARLGLRRHASRGCPNCSLSLSSSGVPEAQSGGLSPLFCTTLGLAGSVRPGKASLAKAHHVAIPSGGLASCPGSAAGSRVQGPWLWAGSLWAAPPTTRLRSPALTQVCPLNPLSVSGVPSGTLKIKTVVPQR